MGDSTPRDGLFPGVFNNFSFFRSFATRRNIDIVGSDVAMDV